MMQPESARIMVVTGIDTGVGKTVATGLLARWFLEHGSRVITMKMAQTGCTGISEDIVEHRRLTGVGLLDEDAEGLTCPYVFPVPCSPHLAARLDGGVIDPGVITGAAQRLAAAYERVLVEGAGGLFVPLDDNTLIIDLIERNRWPVLLVTSPRLGSINHTLAALDALDRRRIPVQGLIYNLGGQGDTDRRIIEDSRAVFAGALEKIGRSVRICDIPATGCTPSFCVDFTALFS